MSDYEYGEFDYEAISQSQIEYLTNQLEDYKSNIEFQLNAKSQVIEHIELLQHDLDEIDSVIQELENEIEICKNTLDSELNGCSDRPAWL